MRPHFAAMAATLVLAMCTGCTSTSPNDEFSSSYKEQAAVYESTLEAFDEQIERVIADARAGQSAETQIAMLEQAQREGEMSLESARAAARATVSCLQDAGLEASYIEQTDAGVTIPNYAVTAPTDAARATRDSCETQHSYWVNYLYQTQESTVQRTFEYIEQQRAALERCLSDAGFPIDPGATSTELAFYSLEVSIRTNQTTDCLFTIGVSGF